MKRFTVSYLGILIAAWIVSAPSPAGAERLRVDDRVFSDRAAGHALAGDMRRARRAAARIDRLDIRDHALARVVVILTRGGKEKAALVVLSRISDAGRRDDAMVDMGIALAGRGRLAEAQKLAFHLDPWRRDRVRAAVAMALAARGRVRAGWQAALGTNDLPRRREALVAFRGGLAHAIKPEAALGAALGAKTRRGRVLSLLAVARRLVLDGKPKHAMTALTWARQQSQKLAAGAALRNRAAADAAMILLRAGDVEGARRSAVAVADVALRQFLLRHIDELRMFMP